MATFTSDVETIRSRARKKIELALAQKQAGKAYRIPLEVGVTLPGAPLTIERIALTQKQQKFEIAAETEPAGVELDPNTWVLMDAKLVWR